MEPRVAQLFSEIEKLRVELLANADVMTDWQRAEEETSQ